MHLAFRAISEPLPGPRWAGLFEEYWPAYRRWWAKDGVSVRPSYAECRRAIRRHMPEILPLWEELTELAGGGDDAARFLSFYGPPAYLSACSQAIWPGEEPLLVRNYDYSPRAFDALILRSEWQGRAVLGMTDGLFGLVDGMNDAGLAVSLTFGGRPGRGPGRTGAGLGIPIVLRYLLETCATVPAAIAVLERVPRRIPSHMSYNVTVLDRDRRYLTAYLAPDRETIVTHMAVATNHQSASNGWAMRALRATVERERFLLQRLTLHVDPEDKFIGAFLRPPLYSTAFGQGFGTLYTAAYRPARGQLDLHWPGSVWHLSLLRSTCAGRPVHHRARRGQVPARRASPAGRSAFGTSPVWHRCHAGASVPYLPRTRRSHRRCQHRRRKGPRCHRPVPVRSARESPALQFLLAELADDKQLHTVPLRRVRQARRRFQRCRI